MICRILNLNNPWWIVVAGIFSLCLAGSTLAQPGGRPANAGPPATINPKRDDLLRQIDESKLRSAEMDIGREEESQKHVQAAIANMKEDFSRIQVVRNDIARNLVARKPLDYRLVSDQTAEINKRATRLNVYMRAHAPEDEKENSLAELKTEEMVSALVRLCKLIDSFTENPALKNAATIDSIAIAKAKKNKVNADRDLLAIIKLSAGLHKKSANLRMSQ